MSSSEIGTIGRNDIGKSEPFTVAPQTQIVTAAEVVEDDQTSHTHDEYNVARKAHSKEDL